MPVRQCYKQNLQCRSLCWLKKKKKDAIDPNQTVTRWLHSTDHSGHQSFLGLDTVQLTCSKVSLLTGIMSLWTRSLSCSTYWGMTSVLLSNSSALCLSLHPSSAADSTYSARSDVTIPMIDMHYGYTLDTNIHNKHMMVMLNSAQRFRHILTEPNYTEVWFN